MSGKILVTGGLGYLGGRVLAHLRRAGRDDLALTTRRAAADRPAWAAEVEVFATGLDDPDGLESACRGVQTVLHFAALNAGSCAADPNRARAVNVAGTEHLLSAAARAGVARVLYMSTAHVYAAPLRGTIDEDTAPANPHPYATTHRAAEDLARAAPLDGLVLRLSNAVGPPADAAADCWMLVANDLCRQAVTTGELVLRGSGLDRRDFVPLSEVARAIGLFLGRPVGNWGGQVFNLGSGRARSVYDLATLIAERWEAMGNPRPTIRRPEPAPGEAGVDLEFRIDRLRAAGIEVDPDITAEIDATLRFCREAFAP